MGISDGSRTLAEVRIAALNGTPGVGISRLVFSLQLDIAAVAKDSPALISNPVCQVYVGTTPAHVEPVGFALAETCWYSQVHEHPTTGGFSVLLDLSADRLAALERLRGGGGLHFRLDLHANADTKFGRFRSMQSMWLDANLSVWTKVLKDLGAADVLLLGIDLPTTGIPPKLIHVVERIRQAHADLIAGRYEATVSGVRMALDAMQEIADLEPSDAVARQAFAGNRDVREAMPKTQRQNLVRSAIRHYSHLAHHIDNAGNFEQFSRHETMFILAAAAAVVWDTIGATLSKATSPQS